MKKFIILSVFLSSVFSFLMPVSALNPVSKTTTLAKIEVYYFHYTRRCATCTAVEAQTKASLATLYVAQYKSGNITFKSVNLDEDANTALAKKCKAEGQALLVISGAKRFDLTDKAFMYAVNNPEKLKAELKKVIDSLL